MSARLAPSSELASRWNLFKLKVDETKCIKCNLCTLHCETQADPYPNEKWKSSECVYCETCAAICPTAAITFPAAGDSGKAPGRRPVAEENPAGLVSGVLLRAVLPDLPGREAGPRKAHPAAGSAARAAIPRRMRQVRRVHESLPDERPPAGHDRSRAGRIVDAGPRARRSAIANITVRSVRRSARRARSRS